jgi:phage-related protein
MILLLLYILTEKVKEQEQEDNPVKEGFDVLGDINNTINSIKNVANSIPNEVRNIGNSIKNTENVITNSVNSATGSINNTFNTVKTDMNQGFDKVKSTTTQVTKEIEDKLVKFGKEVEQKTNDLVINKIKSFFEQLGNILEIVIVVPFKTLFIGIGDIFLQIFAIIKMIGDKITSLPNCIFTYGIKSFTDSLQSIYRYIIPTFIRNIITSIYNFLFKWLVDYILRVIGYTDAVKRCYEFNVNDKVDNMNNTLKNISRTFNSSFGKVRDNPIRL